MSRDNRNDGAAGVTAGDSAACQAERRIERLFDRLPQRWQPLFRRLRAPALRPLRVPFALLLIAGGLFGMLPVLGFWMLPLGLILLAEDIPPLRRLRDRAIARLERHRPHWFAERRAPPSR